MENVLVFIILVVLSYIYIKIAEKFNVIDKPNNRSSHTLPTIRGGGILFFFAVLIFFVSNDFQYPYFVFGILMISIVSFVDDLMTLSSRIRLPFQFVAVFLLLFQIGGISFPFLIIVLLLIVGVLFINIYNFMDGINGITGLYSLSVLLGIYYINRIDHVINDELLIFSIISLVVFGFYNFRKKARFFAGDIGSISIAMVILFSGLSLMIKLESPMILLLILVYGVDSLLTLLYKVYIRESITDPHRHHLYQKFVDIYKCSHLKISLVYAGLQMLVNCIIYYTYKVDIMNQFILFILILSIFIALYVILFRIIEKKDKLSC